MPSLSSFARALQDNGFDSSIVDSFDEVLRDDEIDDFIDEFVTRQEEGLFGNQSFIDEDDLRDALDEEFELDSFSPKDNPQRQRLRDKAKEESAVVIFRTQEDSKVDDIICLPLEGNVYKINGSERPRIPDDTHPNCRCFYEDGITGDDLGQF